MINYYKLDIIPIILNRFKVNDKIIISGMPDDNTSKQILEYCELNNISLIIIDQKNNIKIDHINDNPLKILPTIKNYDSIFLCDDPNWYTVYNELEIIKNTNNQFPLVFICNNLFPHKRRDSYIDPNLIPPKFRHENSKILNVNNISIRDGFYHALEENTPKNGVLTAIEDFLNKNKSIGMMNLKIYNGITILYPKNSISHIRLGKLSEEISEYNIEIEELSNYIIGNQILTNYISKFNISDENLDAFEKFQEEIDEKNKIMNIYENKLQLYDDELDYKDSQIEGFNSKLDLKDSQIKDSEAKLLNMKNEKDNLNYKLNNVNHQVTSLKNEVNQNEQNFKVKEQEFNAQISNLEKEINQNEQNFKVKEQEFNAQISNLEKEINQNEQNFKNKEAEYNKQITMAHSKIIDLEMDISNKKQYELNLQNQIQQANTQINDKINQINIKNKQFKLKQNELDKTQKKLDSIKNQYMSQLSQIDNKEYCISCYKEEILNKHLEIDYLNKNNFIKSFLNPFAYLYLILKSKPKELSLNFKLYKSLKNTNCFDIGFYLNNNEDLKNSKWCKYFSPELHYVCKGFSEKRKFNKKYFNRKSKKDLLDYILDCNQK